MSLTDRIGSAALIVAHPDDEILWFSSIFAAVGKVIICFLETPGDSVTTSARKQFAARFQDPRVHFLELSESMAFGQADWRDPEPSAEGLQLPGGGLVAPLPGYSAARYRTNHEALISGLKPLLVGVPLVFTHNPWGEYGHEEHVQVYRTVAGLRRELGFELWFDTYASDRSATLMARTIARTQFVHESLTTHPEQVAPIEALYRETGCWTWPYDDYRWFETDTFALDPVEPGPHKTPGSRLPVNFISVDFAQLQMPEYSFLQRVQRKLRRLRQTL